MRSCQSCDLCHKQWNVQIDSNNEKIIGRLSFFAELLIDVENHSADHLHNSC
jgi:hypothetical protein